MATGQASRDAAGGWARDATLALVSALAETALGTSAISAWLTSAGPAVAAAASAGRACFWQLRPDGLLVLHDAWASGEDALPSLAGVTVDPASSPTTASVLVEGRDVVGSVDVAAGADSYLAMLSKLGATTHATVPWTVGSRVLGVLSVHDPVTIDEATLHTLRVIGTVVGIVAELKKRQAQLRSAATEYEQRSMEVELLKDVATSVSDADHPDAIIEAVRVASQIVSPPGTLSRQGWFLRLRGDELIAVAEYDASGYRLDDGYRLTELPALKKVVESGEVIIDDFTARELEPAVSALVWNHHLTCAALVPVRRGGEVIGVLAIAARDHDGFSALHVELLTAIANIIGLAIGDAERAQALRRSVQRSEQLERMKADFLNLAAHELRSPLAIVRGYLSMLGDGSVPGPDLAHVIGVLESKAAEMAHLIEEMLDTARLDEVGIRETFEVIDVAELVADVIAPMEPQLRGRNRVSVRAITAPLLVRGDRPRLVTALFNLVDNAAKFSPEGGEVNVVCGLTGTGQVEVTVSDQGLGITADHLPELFRRFGRLVTAENSHIRGVGLGLYLARKVVRAHGGDITVASEPGRGSAFRVTLPSARPLDAPPAAAASQ